MLVVDDHPLVREGLARLIDLEPDLVVCASVATSGEALAALVSARPDVAVVDVSLESSQGLELVRGLKARRPDLPVVMLSMHDEAVYAERALRAGASGYVMKKDPPQRVVEALHRALQGRLTFSESVTDRLLAGGRRGVSRRPSLPTERLSDRELEVLGQIGAGRTTRQIAEALRLSMKTVQAHREHIKEKLGLRDGASLTRFAVQWVDSGGSGQPSDVG